MADLVGNVIANRYRIQAFIGRGGMAEVYKVWDQNRSVFLAMKVLHPDLAEDKFFFATIQARGPNPCHAPAP